MLPGVSSPDNAENRFPPSLYACYQVLQVPSISKYEVHLCPSGCFFPFEPFPDNVDVSAHLQSCTGCMLCCCPCCSAARFRFERSRATPNAMCYLFHDVLQQAALTEDWFTRVSCARAKRLSPWYHSSEGQKCLKHLEEHGYPMASVRCPPD
jgi:hypothetical protein